MRPIESTPPADSGGTPAPQAAPRPAPVLLYPSEIEGRIEHPDHGSRVVILEPTARAGVPTATPTATAVAVTGSVERSTAGLEQYATASESGHAADPAVAPSATAVVALFPAATPSRRTELASPGIDAPTQPRQAPCVESQGAAPSGGLDGDAAAVIDLFPTAAPTPVIGPVRQVVRGITGAGNWLFGAVTMIGALAFLGSFPLTQFLTLGYLLEAAGRIGRTGRLEQAFPGIRQAARVGGMVLGGWLVVWPLRYAMDVLVDSTLIDPDSPATQTTRRVVFALWVATPLHILLALAHGGRLNYFFRPLSNVLDLIRRLRRGSYIRTAWESAVQFVRALRLWHYFLLGLRGFLGAAAWLVIPITIMAAGRGAGAMSLLGGLLLLPVLFHLPFLQAHFAATDRWRAMFELRTVRERARHAPIAFLFAFAFTLLAALPLYLLKIEIIPREATWLPALVFVVTIFPMKLFAGWAYHRASRRPERSHFLIRFACRAFMWPVAALYAFIVFLTQYTGWYGVRSLYEQHAFLLPVPFF